MLFKISYYDSQLSNQTKLASEDELEKRKERQ